MFCIIFYLLSSSSQLSNIQALVSKQETSNFANVSYISHVAINSLAEIKNYQKNCTGPKSLHTQQLF